MAKKIASIVLAIAVLACAGPAFAQEKVDGATKDALKKVDTVPPATAPKLSEQAGTTEPSSKTPGTSSDPNAVFVKGVLVVPGAVTDVDTAPAKHWARTDADDQIPIAGYRLKQLSPEQLQKIAKELNSQRDAPTASPAGGEYAVIGAEVPAPIALETIAPMPTALAESIPELRGTGFMRAAGKILIVKRSNNIVVGVLEG